MKTDDDIVTRLLNEAQTSIYYELKNEKLFFDAVREIERLRKLMSDYVSLWHQIDTDVNVKTSQAYYAKFYEMDKEVRGE